MAHLVTTKTAITTKTAKPPKPSRLPLCPVFCRASTRIPKEWFPEPLGPKFEISKPPVKKSLADLLDECGQHLWVLLTQALVLLFRKKRRWKGHIFAMHISGETQRLWLMGTWDVADRQQNYAATM